jgi:hypothetical protein
MKRPKIPEYTKAALEKGVQEFIAAKFRPHIGLNADSARQHGFNYVVDVYTQWRGNFFYIMSKYCRPREGSDDEFFEVRSMRMEFVGSNRFHLAYMRHTGKWWVVYRALPMKQCLDEIKGNELFWPSL